MKGLDIFRRHFANNTDDYAVIGGAACDLLLDGSPVRARATKDIDMLLFVEGLSEEFFEAFWGFVTSGGYKVKCRISGSPVLFRFREPHEPSYPQMIELFSRDSRLVEGFSQSHVISLQAPDDLSDLSAILLDDDYYNLAKNGRVVIDSVSTLGIEEIIVFKAKAYLELSKKRDRGEAVHGDDIKKHRTDVIRLATQLSDRIYPLDSSIIRNDMREFLDQLETSYGELRALRAPIKDPIALVSTLRSVFDL
jgi:hypothetical protein